jgi:hypothetical protein
VVVRVAECGGGRNCDVQGWGAIAEVLSDLAETVTRPTSSSLPDLVPCGRDSSTHRPAYLPRRPRDIPDQFGVHNAARYFLVVNTII